MPGAPSFGYSRRVGDAECCCRLVPLLPARRGRPVCPVCTGRPHGGGPAPGATGPPQADQCPRCPGCHWSRRAGSRPSACEPCRRFCTDPVPPLRPPVWTGSTGPSRGDTQGGRRDAAPRSVLSAPGIPVQAGAHRPPGVYRATLDDMRRANLPPSQGGNRGVSFFHNLRTGQRVDVSAMAEPKATAVWESRIRNSAFGTCPDIVGNDLGIQRKRAPPDALKAAPEPSSPINATPHTGQRPHDKRGPQPGRGRLGEIGTTRPGDGYTAPNDAELTVQSPRLTITIGA